MKRSKPLVRRGWPQGRSARILTHSRKARAFAAELEEKRRWVIGRSEGICEVCYCAPVEVIHHRLRRSQGGTNDLKNLLGVCNPCHFDIHAHPARSYANGSLLKGVS